MTYVEGGRIGMQVFCWGHGWPRLCGAGAPGAGDRDALLRLARAGLRHAGAKHVLTANVPGWPLTCALAAAEEGLRLQIAEVDAGGPAGWAAEDAAWYERALLYKDLVSFQRAPAEGGRAGQVLEAVRFCGCLADACLALWDGEEKGAAWAGVGWCLSRREPKRVLNLWKSWEKHRRASSPS